MSKEKEKKQNQSGSPSSPSQEQIDALAQQYMPFILPILDKIMNERYLKPIQEDLRNIKNAINSLISGLEQKTPTNPNPTPIPTTYTSQDPSQQMALMQNPFIQLFLSKFLSGGSSLEKDEALLTRIANIVQAVDSIKGKSIWDTMLPRVFVRMLVKDKWITEDEHRDIMKQLDKM